MEMAAASSSGVFFHGTEGEEIIRQRFSQTTEAASSSATRACPPPKKKRNQLGAGTDPETEVIALSPRTLTAANRFICEICNKGFQREQNLQLHRRGHNLPWKLKQKSKTEVKRKVYLCPEVTCVHHDPSRALGDLTGIKKHFFRKHGEKKFKCDKCSKRYAVQSDWKAHSKTCGTREYRCDCGTLFSRRDSFITHRAFCDALAQDSTRHSLNLHNIGMHNIYGSSNPISDLGLPQVGSQAASQFQEHHHAMAKSDHGGSSNFGGMSLPSYFYSDPQEQLQNKNFHGLVQLPGLHGNSDSNPTSASNIINLGFLPMNNGCVNGSASSGFLNPQDQLLSNANEDSNREQRTVFFSGNNMNDQISLSHSASSLVESSFRQGISPLMSATALLQQAAQMSSTSSNAGSSKFVWNFGSPSTSTADKYDPSILPSRFQPTMVNHDPQIQSLMMNTPLAPPSFNFDRFNSNGLLLPQHGNPKLLEGVTSGIGEDDKLTLDFLGVGGMVRNFGGGTFIQADQRHHVSKRSTYDSETNSTQENNTLKSSEI